jgi:hypothetical protein
MRRLLVVIVGAAIVAWQGVSLGGPVVGVSNQTPEIAGLRSYVVQYDFKGGERASVIAIGKGTSNIGVYVYDNNGNCVAWDDIGRAESFDDMAVEWYPPQTGQYMVEVRNNGTRGNTCKIFVR